jgi:threonine/homoserine/homoserine lactone efflux protein
MSLDTFLLYLVAWTLMAISPGPAVLFVMSNAARHGMHGAVAATAGIVSGHLVCFGAVALGLAALLAKFSEAMTALRILGALYLMYLGARMIFSRVRKDQPIDAAPPAAPDRRGVALQGLGVQVTNPKNLMFVLAFLPQFIDPARPLAPQLLIMLAVTMVIDAVFLLAYAQLAARGSRALKGSRFVTWLERVFGAALIYFGLNLLFSRK